MLEEVLKQVVIVVVGLMLPLSTALFVGRERLAKTRVAWRSRLRTSAPAIAVLLVVLVINRIMRQAGSAISDVIAVNMTGTFYRIEGEFVLLFQSIASPELNAYFSFIYIYGYAFMLIFPVIAYFALSDTRTFRRLLVAYSLNYLIGLSLYLLITAYGPRNVMPGDLATTMLYNTDPQYQYLTRQVNRNTNVFPSLHTSLSATIALFAYETRSSYPKWLPVAVVLAVSVAISTMYLGIHWGIDVAAGLVLAAVCVTLSYRFVGRWTLSELRDRVRRQIGGIHDTEQ